MGAVLYTCYLVQMRLIHVPRARKWGLAKDRSALTPIDVLSGLERFDLVEHVLRQLRVIWYPQPDS